VGGKREKCSGLSGRSVDFEGMHPDMLDCCRPLNDIAQVGLTLSEFACLARCNGLQAQVVSPLLDWSPQEREKGLERFRNDLRRVSRGDGTMALSYSRKTLGQTGDGHFSPIGALCEEKDMVLILDVARFKCVAAPSPGNCTGEGMLNLLFLLVQVSLVLGARFARVRSHVSARQGDGATARLCFAADCRQRTRIA
jgi:hypothetical protein